MNNKIAAMLSLCKRAGKLVLGNDVVAQAVANGTAKKVFLCWDLSPKSKKEIERVCTKFNKKFYELPLSMDELDFFLGKRVGIIAVTDMGMANGVLAKLDIGKEDIE